MPRNQLRKVRNKNKCSIKAAFTTESGSRSTADFDWHISPGDRGGEAFLDLLDQQYESIGDLDEDVSTDLEMVERMGELLSAMVEVNKLAQDYLRSQSSQ